METAFDLAFRYWRFALAGLILAWSVGIALTRGRTFRQRRWLSFVPLLLGLPILAGEAMHPLVIASPLTHASVHPGEAVTVRVKMRPAFLANVYPRVRLDLYRCYGCVESPQGVSYTSVRAGEDFVFVVTLPSDLPDGEIYLSAVAERSITDEHPAMRTEGIGLAVHR